MYRRYFLNEHSKERKKSVEMGTRQECEPFLRIHLFISKHMLIIPKIY